MNIGTRQKQRLVTTSDLEQAWNSVRGKKCIILPKEKEGCFKGKNVTESKKCDFPSRAKRYLTLRSQLRGRVKNPNEQIMHWILTGRSYAKERQKKKQEMDRILMSFSNRELQVLSNYFRMRSRL